MAWPEVKEIFQRALNLERAKILAEKKKAQDLPVTTNRLRIFMDDNPSPAIADCNQRLERLKKYEELPASLEEIKEFCPNIDEQFLDDFLNASINALRTQNIDHHKVLSDLKTELRAKINANDNQNFEASRENRQYHQFNSKIAIGVGSLFLVMLIIGAPVPVVGLIIAGGVGLVATLLVAAFSGYKMHKNDQFLGSEQYKKVSDFVKEVTPKIELVNEGTLTSAVY